MANDSGSKILKNNRKKEDFEKISVKKCNLVYLFYYRTQKKAKVLCKKCIYVSTIFI